MYYFECVRVYVMSFICASLFIVPWVTEAVWVSTQIKNPLCQYIILVCGVILTILSTFNSGLLGMGKYGCNTNTNYVNDYVLYGIQFAHYGICLLVPWIVINCVMSWVISGSGGIIHWYTHLFCYTPIIFGITSYCTACVTNTERDSSDHISRDDVEIHSDSSDAETVPIFQPLSHFERVCAIFGSILLSFGLWIAEVVAVVNYCSADTLPLFLIVVSTILAVLVALPTTIIGFNSESLYRSGWLNCGLGVPPKRTVMIIAWVIVIRIHTLYWYVQLMCHVPVFAFLPFFCAARAVKDIL